MEELLNNLIISIKNKLESVNILSLLRKTLNLNFKSCYCFMRYLGLKCYNYNLHLLKDKIFTKQSLI
uniref:Macaca fascicularis brain cDNA clone: QtrA-17627, similar to human similar to 60S ribosomal protein L23a (LOC400725), mRNA, RefSeq: XM_375669.1 n=1 Tax=Macaca fascicularis TaxID=9541 RepID=I7GB15_MACFA|nr:unnamed protein product [Macaca fascicularis]